MKCQYCGNEVAPGCQNCPSCGAAAPQPAQPQSTVPQNGPGGQFAQPTANVPAAGYTQKSRLVYILLGLFLGGFGVHNFYAGYHLQGAIQLLITLFLGWLIVPWIGVGIWVLIEICTIDKDSNSVPMK